MNDRSLGENTQTAVTRQSHVLQGIIRNQQGDCKDKKAPVLRAAVCVLAAGGGKTCLPLEIIQVFNSKLISSMIA
jgi:hypothetical protein